jgi:hypothetical protein
MIFSPFFYLVDCPLGIGSRRIARRCTLAFAVEGIE